MQDIFISTLSRSIRSWTAAFPNSKVLDSLPETPIDADNTSIFWLHSNIDRQQWLLNAIEIIKKTYKPAKIVVLADIPNYEEFIAVLSKGATGYCHSYIDANILREIRTVITQGGLWIGQDMLKQLIQNSIKRVSSHPSYIDSQLSKLSVREKAVAIEVSKGFSNREVASGMNITERTVKAHLTAIFERLGAKDRLELALKLNRPAERIPTVRNDCS